MGASDWIYFAPYQEDIEKALQELRQQVFEIGDYYRIEPVDVTPEYLASMPPGATDYMNDWIEHQKSYIPPTTIRELQNWNADLGTHSILDIEHTSAKPEIGTVAPLEPGQLTEFFGTTQPTRMIIESRILEFSNYLSNTLDRTRYIGTYVIVYKGDRPDEIFFIGYSGD
jgi:hypothetical protein